MLDASGSNEVNFAMSQELSRLLVQGMNFAGSRTRVGLVIYTDTTQIKFHLKTYSNQLEVCIHYNLC